MAITYEELSTSREMSLGVSETTLTREFMVYGTDNPDEAANIGPQLNDYWDDELRVVERRFSWPVKPAGGGTEGGVLRLTVLYRFRPVVEAGTPDEFALNVGTASERIFKTPSSQTIFDVEYPALSQQHFGVIGSDDDKNEPGDLINAKYDGKEYKVEGVDVLIPTIEWSETHERSSLPAAYQQVIGRLTAKVNHNTWRGWPARTWLFLGAQAARRKGENWRITYNFRIGVAATCALVAVYGTIEYTKEAHDYVWFRDAQIHDPATDTIEHKVYDVHVARVYQDADFAELGIGNGAMS